MGVGDFDSPELNHYPMGSNWYNVIAPITRFRLRLTQFPPINWNPDILSLVTLGEFAATNWHDAIDPGPPPDEATTNTEVDYLIGLAQTSASSGWPKSLRNIPVITSTIMVC